MQEKDCGYDARLAGLPLNLSEKHMVSCAVTLIIRHKGKQWKHYKISSMNVDIKNIESLKKRRIS